MKKTYLPYAVTILLAIGAIGLFVVVNPFSNDSKKKKPVAPSFYSPREAATKFITLANDELSSQGLTMTQIGCLNVRVNGNNVKRVKRGKTFLCAARITVTNKPQQKACYAYVFDLPPGAVRPTKASNQPTAESTCTSLFGP